MDIAVATRPVRPEDATLFCRLWERLSPETVYRRFHAPLRRPPVPAARLVAACAVHDLGLLADIAPRHRARRFPVRAAGVLEELAEQHDVDPARTRPWSLAVAGHLRWHGSADEPFEAALLRRSAWLDATGLGRREDRQLLTTLDLPTRTRAGNLRLLARVGTVCVRDLVGCTSVRSGVVPPEAWSLRWVGRRASLSGSPASRRANADRSVGSSRMEYLTELLDEKDA